MIRVTELRFYPVKSCRGVSVPELTLDRWGPRDDRRFLFVDEAGRFLTQREHHRLARVEARLAGDSLALSAPGMPALSVSLRGGQERAVTVWRYSTVGRDAGAEASGWASRFLGVPAHLVAFDDATFRPANPEYAKEGSSAGRFSDGYPVLLASESSLADLNERIRTRGGAPVPMERFRPNVVVAGAEPFAEDRFGSLRIGEVRFRMTKPCDRCAVTTVDQGTGEAGKEPLATLATFRKRDGKVYFAVNLVHEAPGTLRVGDAVELDG